MTRRSAILAALGLALLSTADGAVVTYERVDAFAFSGDGRFLAVHHVKDAPGSPTTIPIAVCAAGWERRRISRPGTAGDFCR